MTGAIDCRIGAQRAQNAQAGHYVADNVVAPSITASNDPSRSPQSSEVTQQVYAVLQASCSDTVGALTDGAHQGGA